MTNEEKLLKGLLQMKSELIGKLNNKNLISYNQELVETINKILESIK